MKITPREKRRHAARREPHFSLSAPRLAFLAWGDFPARSRFACSIVTEELNGRLLVVYLFSDVPVAVGVAVTVVLFR